MKQTFLYVEIGRKIPYYLKTSLMFLRFFNPDADIYYISDINVANRIRKKYDLKCIKFDSYQFRDVRKKVISLYPDKSIHRKNYWLNSLMRLFAIKQFIESTEISHFIHLESDSLPLLNKKDYEDLFRMKIENSTCFNFSDQCVPTMILITNRDQYINFINFLQNAILENLYSPEWFWNDIFSLNLGRDKGFFGALPVVPNLEANNPRIKGKLLFDTAIYGKYLLGEDPRNHKFIIKSGTIDIEAPDYISKQTAKWKITLINEQPQLNMMENGDSWKIAVIHNYAKRKLPIFDTKSKVWNQIIREANNESKRKRRFSFRLFSLALFHLLYRLIVQNRRY
jgi:hypothetical protein